MSQLFEKVAKASMIGHTVAGGLAGAGVGGLAGMGIGLASGLLHRNKPGRRKLTAEQKMELAGNRARKGLFIGAGVGGLTGAGGLGYLAHRKNGAQGNTPPIQIPKPPISHGTSTTVDEIRKNNEVMKNQEIEMGKQIEDLRDTVRSTGESFRATRQHAADELNRIRNSKPPEDKEFDASMAENYRLLNQLNIKDDEADRKARGVGASIFGKRRRNKK